MTGLAHPRVTGRHGARLLGLAVALVLSGCAAALDCDRIPGVRPGVCPLPVAERQPAPDVTLPVLQTDAAPAAGVMELSLAELEGRVVIVNFWESVVRRVPQRTADVIEDVAVKLFT